MSQVVLTQRETDAKAIVSQKMKQINALVGGDEKKASAYGSALMSLASNKGLKDCELDSVLDVGFQIVQAGLNPNPLFNEAYAVAYKSGDKFIAQLQVGAKGYVTLAYRAGWTVKTRIVYKCDEFSMDVGDFDEKVTLVPNLSEQKNDDPKWIHKNIVGVLVMAKDSHGEVHKQFVPNSKIEKIRLKSPNQKNASEYSYIWKEWTEEMISAKAIKYVLKRLPTGDTVQDVIHADEAYEKLPSPKPTAQNVDQKFLGDVPK